MKTDMDEIAFLMNIGLMLTYKCPIACPHCIVECGPKKNSEMSFVDCLRWITQAHSYKETKIRGLALTGGEPFTDMDKLAHISAFAHQLGFVQSVVTNAFWAKTKKEAIQTLAEVPSIQMVSISTDIYHQHFIPIDYIRNAVWAMKLTGKAYNIAVCTENFNDQEYLSILSRLREFVDEEKIRGTLVFPIGRAEKRVCMNNYSVTNEPPEAACSTASSPIIFPNGDVCACIGPLLKLSDKHPLFLGNLYNENLHAILRRAEMNPILHMIRVWGARKLAVLLHENGYSHLLPEKYLSNCPCDVCYKLLKDEKIVGILCNLISKNSALFEEVAYARVYYLKENSMAMQMNVF